MATMTNAATTFDAKRKRIMRYLVDMGYEGMVIGGPRNFAWLMGGQSNCVDHTARRGEALLKVTSRYTKLLTTNIEAARMREEVVGGLPVDVVEVPWHEPDAFTAELRRDPRRLRLVGDVSVPGGGVARMTRPFWTLQVPLLEDEIARYCALGADAGAVVGEVCRAIEPGWTEAQVVAEVARALLMRGMQHPVLLVGGDGRMERYRHPVPTHAPIERQCMLVVCAERGGLVANLTRTVHFGPVPDALAAKHHAVASVEAALVYASQPGASLGDVFQQGVAAYATAGYADAWQEHHQGGTTGYNTRDVIATPDAEETLCAVQAVAWNPSLSGAKSEDTFLVTDDGPELMTPTPDWPSIDVEGGGATLARPGILER